MVGYRHIWTLHAGMPYMDNRILLFTFSAEEQVKRGGYESEAITY